MTDDDLAATTREADALVERYLSTHDRFDAPLSPTLSAVCLRLAALGIGLLALIVAELRKTNAATRARKRSDANSN
jgi:hypothetical protein